MNEPENLLERTFNFSVNVLNMLCEIKSTPVTVVVIRQLARSATSIGANYEESQASQSKDDFYYRIGVCLREARESNYWLRIIDKMNWIKNQEALIKLINESSELTRILGKIYSGRNRIKDKR